MICDLKYYLLNNKFFQSKIKLKKLLIYLNKLVYKSKLSYLLRIKLFNFWRWFIWKIYILTKYGAWRNGILIIEKLT